jgi:uncharacterized protein with ParB-like and HNH nuclease domain
MSLESEISKSVNDIKTDSYSMSIGELNNIYKDKEIDISPSYQRYFRWSINQKSSLIESIILGIPIPPIFVAQEGDGNWNIIDGLQRVSTILEFMGELRVPEDFSTNDQEDKDNIEDEDEDEDEDEENLEVQDDDETETNQEEVTEEIKYKKLSGSKLVGTKNLPSLQNMTWANMSQDIRRKFKRRKIDVIIIDSTENPKAKYEMFQRLNTNVTELKEQEIRNCLMAMVNPVYLNIVGELSSYPKFNKMLKITKRQFQEQLDKEIIVRYLISRYIDTSKITSNGNITEYVTDSLLDMMADSDINVELLAEQFKTSIDLLDEVIGEDVFIKSGEGTKNKFSLALFESIIVGITENVESLKTNKDKVKASIESIITQERFIEATKKGQRALTRFKLLTELSKEIYA